MTTADGNGAGLALLISRLRQAIAGFSAALQKVTRSERYRPERRYMRGKRSKSQAKDSSTDRVDEISEIES